MKTTQQPLQMTIRNGTLFINENLQIEFAEAFLTLPDKAKSSYEFHSEKEEKKEKPLLQVAAATKKTADVDTDQVREFIKNCLAEQGPTKLKLLSSMVESAGHDIKYSSLNNICWTMKKKGELTSPAAGIYALPGKAKKDPVEKKTSKPKVERAKVQVVEGQNAEVKKMIIDFLTENGEQNISDILCHVQEVYPQVTRSYIKNIFYTGKNDGTILNPGRAMYAVPKSAKVVSVTKVKGGLGPTPITTTTPEPSTEEIKETRVYQKYTTGDDIMEGDEVQVLTAEAVTEDDILSFPEDVSEQFATVVRCDEGSNMINIQVNRAGRELLVYPHWVRLTRRSV